MELMDALNKSHPFFVRCIRSNAIKVSLQSFNLLLRKHVTKIMSNYTNLKFDVNFQVILKLIFFDFYKHINISG